MNAETKIVEQSKSYAKAYEALVKPGFERLGPHLQKTRELQQALDGLVLAGDKTAAKSAEQLKAKLASLEASVTMIGQVKAGKTSLVNAMVGWPDLLPADVNPWTSVVTSLHLCPEESAATNKARFQFFERDEWDKLVVNGGRVGELAGRAGANDELEKVRRQVAEMQEKSRQRLGRKFELLLGQCHNYGYFDSTLIERYVCMGDDFEDNTNTTQAQGRFADITKSAEIFMHRPELPMAMCIRDTPGVNDTFMMREQITIRSIRDSRICVVVLSAHQAMSTVDMALIRLIANVKSREVVIFVNRIDELSDPARQVPEIADSIRAILRDHHGPESAQIIFGSAYWANSALTGSAAGLTEDSASALANWAEEELKIPQGGALDSAAIWQLSGVPALFGALSERIAEGVGQEALDGVARNAWNLAGSIKSAENLLSLRQSGGPKPPFDRTAVTHEFRRIEIAGRQVLDTEFKALLADFYARVDRSHHSFLDRATAALIEHLEMFGDEAVWKYDPTGLRVLMRSAYQLFAKRAQDSAKKVLAATAKDITGLYRRYQLVPDPRFEVEPPGAPRIPSPVLLGQTIALDLQANWWSRWWRKKRGYSAFADEFSKLIKAETDPIAIGLKRDHALVMRSEAIAVFSDLLREQYAILCNLAEQRDMTDSDLAAFFGMNSQKDRQVALGNAMKTLEKICGTSNAGKDDDG